MIGYYNYTVILTYIGLISGLLGIFASIEGHPIFALGALMFAGFCDMFDGLVARTKKDRTDKEKKFGIQLDSLADFVCYGILPVVIVYTTGVKQWYALIAYGIFSLAALIRLAYFNVMEDERQEQTTEARKSYEGLPVTSVALILPLLFPIISRFETLASILFTVLFLAIAFFFIYKFKVPKFKLKGMSILVAIGVVIYILMLLRNVIYRF
ncbi:MAG: CDP-alcohol phosphatidyltransferase family protein [Clostridia bacterium]|nr:CDP-alcohol phosphatidyltransferase family protein [Clostridia bacterium]